MPRHELLEAILAAQFELEYAEPRELPQRKNELDILLTQAVLGTHLTHRDLLWALRDRYKDYKRACLIAEAKRRSL